MCYFHAGSGVTLHIGQLTVQSCVIEEASDDVAGIVKYDGNVEILSGLKSSKYLVQCSEEEMIEISFFVIRKIVHIHSNGTAGVCSEGHSYREYVHDSMRERSGSLSHCLSIFSTNYSLLHNITVEFQ